MTYKRQYAVCVFGPSFGTVLGMYGFSGKVLFPDFGGRGTLICTLTKMAEGSIIFGL